MFLIIVLSSVIIQHYPIFGGGGNSLCSAPLITTTVMFIIKACFDYGILRYRAKKKSPWRDPVTVNRGLPAERKLCENNLTVIVTERRRHRSFASASNVCIRWIVSPFDEAHSRQCMEQRCDFLLSCLFSCRCTQSLGRDGSTLSAIRTLAGSFCKELTVSTVNKPSTRRLRSNTLYLKPEISVGYKTPTVIFKR